MSAKKSRFDGLDVAAMAAHLKRSALGFKLANVYDGAALGVGGAAGGGGEGGGRGVYVFKLADPSGGAASAGSAAAAPSGEGDAKHINDGGVEEATAAQDSKRAMLLIESGVRFHPTT